MLSLTVLQTPLLCSMLMLLLLMVVMTAAQEKYSEPEIDCLLLNNSRRVCYTVHNDSVVTWARADEVCRQSGQQLARLADDITKEHLMRQLSKNSSAFQTSFWTSCQSRGNQCTYLSSASLPRWKKNVTSCNAQFNFICERVCEYNWTLARAQIKDGQKISSRSTTVEECKFACASHPGCTSIDWRRDLCWLGGNWSTISTVTQDVRHYDFTCSGELVEDKHCEDDVTQERRVISHSFSGLLENGFKNGATALSYYQSLLVTLMMLVLSLSFIVVVTATAFPLVRSRLPSRVKVRPLLPDVDTLDQHPNDRNAAHCNPYQLQSPPLSSVEVPVILTHFQRKPTVNGGYLSMERLDSTSTVTTVPPSSQSTNQSSLRVTSHNDIIHSNNEVIGIYSNEQKMADDSEYANEVELNASLYCNAVNSFEDCTENCYSEVRTVET